MQRGILVGSACEAGEIFRAVLGYQSDEQIERLVNFYDYLEIQPIDNNEFLILSEKSDDRKINSKEDIMKINQRIVELGEMYNKPVVATCDVHFLEPEDEIYRRIILAGKGYRTQILNRLFIFVPRKRCWKSSGTWERIRLRRL